MDTDKLETVSRPVNAQGGTKDGDNGVKESKYRIGYKKIGGRIENGKGTRQEDLDGNADQLPHQIAVPSVSHQSQLGFQ